MHFIFQGRSPKTTVKQEGPPTKKIQRHQRAVSPGSDLDEIQASTVKDNCAEVGTDSAPGSDDEDDYLNAQTWSSSPLGM